MKKNLLIVSFMWLLVGASPACTYKEVATLDLSIDNKSFILSLHNSSDRTIIAHPLKYGKYVEIVFTKIEDAEDPWIVGLFDSFDVAEEYEAIGSGGSILSEIPFSIVSRSIGLGQGCYRVVAIYYFSDPQGSYGSDYSLKSNLVETCDLWITQRRSN